jgi:hypothetical protein
MANKRTSYFGHGLRGFYFHKEAENEAGYNYYGYIHRSGEVLIMRETIADGNILFANGQLDFESAWTNRVTLDYDYINKI